MIETGALIITLIILNMNAAAQGLPSITDTIRHCNLNEQRLVGVVLPEGYKNDSANKYDVLYVLDAEDDARKVFNIERFLEDYSFIPPNIIVHIFSIYFNDRNKDFTPSHLDSLPTSGGAGLFLSFMKNELMPFINRKYPNSGENTLYGHSFGGLFTMYTFLNEPQLFKSYILTDPSLWWDNGLMNREIEKKLGNPIYKDRTIWIGGRDGLDHDEMGLTGMENVFTSRAPEGLKWKSVTYPNETHFSLIYKNTYDGLKFSYSGYNPGAMEFHPMAGIILKNKPFHFLFYDPLPEDPPVRYTTDGSEPTENSLLMKIENSIEGETIKIKSFCYRDRFDTTLVARYSYGKTLPSEPSPVNSRPGGWNYYYYEGSWDELPDFKQLVPLESGIAGADFNINKLRSQNNFAVLQEGYIEIEKGGYYTFIMTSDDGARFFLGNTLLIDERGSNWSITRSYIIPLERGYYPIRLEYFQKWNAISLQLLYIPPDRKREILIPLHHRYGQSTDK
jgi:predicted alpha/beta superfamily hydrolase